MSSPPAPPTDQPPSSGGPPERDKERRIDLTHGDPPAELLDQMAHADEINMRLRRSGRELCFALSGDGRSVQIELRDSDGRVLRILSLSEAVELAEGGALPG
ncbi:MAG TPA: hypothetical protein VNV44_03970 [Solirubrobacteraceae bacterium]|jgi:hypothetical protein|nr:hypothetical protein [Solirubrobacteraceae bacterium]